MSVFFSIYNRNNKPVAQKIVSTMHGKSCRWQPDTQGVWLKEQTALGHAMLWNTPQSQLEQLPGQLEHLAITMDARLDNRAELAGQLGLSADQIHRIPDSTLILKAYLKWGENCPEYLLGDFSFVIWDQKKQHIFCARDQAGIRQLYYHLSPALFACGNDLQGLLSHPDIPEEINDSAVANFIVNGTLISPTLPFFQSVRKLPPAHCLTVTADSVRKRCYWRLEDVPRRPYTAPCPKPRGLTMQPGRLIRTHMLAYWLHGHLQNRVESWAAAAIEQRLEYSYPLLDKRILEFSIAVPGKYYMRRGTGRYLFRKAADTFLPEDIAWMKKYEEKSLSCNPYTRFYRQRKQFFK